MAGIPIIPGTIEPGALPIRYYERELFAADRNQADCYRLVMVQSGTGIILFNGQRRVLTAPVIFCLNESDRTELVETANLSAESIAFHPKIVNHHLDLINIKDQSQIHSLTDRLDSDNFRPFIKRDQPYAGQLNVGPATFQRAWKLLKAIGIQLQNPPDGFWPCRTRSYLLELLFLLFQLSFSENWMDELTPKNDPSPADEIILYLINHYPEKITIGDLTCHFHLNRNSLYQQFETATGLPLITYLIKLRVKIASVLLGETSMPVGEIMERVGYTDLTHFGRQFKKEMGCTPHAYRQFAKSKDERNPAD